MKLSSIKNKEDNGKILFVGSTLQIIFSVISILLVVSGMIGLVYKDIRFLGVIAITTGIIESLLRNMLVGMNSERLCINNALIKLKNIKEIEFKEFTFLFQICIIKANTVENIIISKSKLNQLKELLLPCYEHSMN